jgi:hypothetical protein
MHSRRPTVETNPSYPITVSSLKRDLARIIVDMYGINEARYYVGDLGVAGGASAKARTVGGQPVALVESYVRGGFANQFEDDLPKFIAAMERLAGAHGLAVDVVNATTMALVKPMQVNPTGRRRVSCRYCLSEQEIPFGYAPKRFGWVDDNICPGCAAAREPQLGFEDPEEIAMGDYYTETPKLKPRS